MVDVWSLIGFGGLLLGVFGSGCLVIIGSNWFSNNVIQPWVDRHWTDSATNAIERLRVGYPLLSKNDGFRHVISILEDNYLKRYYKEKADIRTIRKGKVDDNGERLKITTKSGTTKHLSATIGELEKHIKKVHKKKLESLEDRGKRYAFEIILIGFLLRSLSYFM